MAKKAATSHMNQTERVAGTIFFIVYLLVLPLLALMVLLVFSDVGKLIH